MQEQKAEKRRRESGEGPAAPSIGSGIRHPAR